MEVLAGRCEQRNNVQRHREEMLHQMMDPPWQQICSHALRGCKELERAGDCAEVAAGPQARTLCLALHLLLSSA